MNLPLPFRSNFDDVDALSNWTNHYQEYYNSHIEDERIKKNFTFTLVKFINDITFALNKDSPTVGYTGGPATSRVITEALEYLKARDKDTGKPLMRYFEVKWQSYSSVQVMAKTEKEAIEKAIVLAEEDPKRVNQLLHDSKIEAEEVSL